jgi:glycosyltransferase involved in cell wall biosynthesis
MNRLALVPSEPIRPRMAGIGIRYLELARRLPAHGLEITLVTAGGIEDVPEVPEGVSVRAFVRGALRKVLGDADAVLAQGQLANDVLLEMPDLPCAIDLYDPWLVENLHYAEGLGLGPYRNDHATWVLQLTRGDFFLCSCEEQRLYYQGLLTALGRVNPPLVARDPDLNRLIATLPFGVPESMTQERLAQVSVSGDDSEPGPILPPRSPGERRILFGGLYDWYDPWPVLEAIAERQEGDWTLLLVRNPNPGSTPQERLAEVESWCRRRGLWQSRVQTFDWLPAERRYDLLREVDVLAATHQPSLETRLSLRTRFLDALAVGCPVLATEGGAMSRLLVEHDAGWVVPPCDARAVRVALEELLADPTAKRAGAKRLIAEFHWSRVVEPLVRFAQAPYRDNTKEDFAFVPETRVPSERALLRRPRQWLRRQWRHWQRRFGPRSTP